MRPILCIGRIDGTLTIETRRWLWKPCAPLLARRRSKDNGLVLLYYHSHAGRALRLGEHKWLTKKGIHGDIRPA